MRRADATFALLLAAPLLSGCAAVKEWAGVRLLYDRAPVPATVLRDLPYAHGSEDPKQRLDIYLPEGRGWPVLIFVHGGGWTSGDKGLTVSGADVYGNVGRYYASRGIGTAVVNYRLQPEVGWRDQAADVASAVEVVIQRSADLGADTDALFIAGHSAGAWLAAYTALAPAALDGGVFCGVIPVSGVAYDLADERTYELGAERSYYEERFAGDSAGDDWTIEASVVPRVSSRAPPFLLIYGSREWPALVHQNQILHQALAAAGVASRVVVARQSHESMVLALSHEGKAPAVEMLRFIRDSDCGS